MRISRDQLLMAIARLVAQRSTCLRGQVGAVIARDGRVLSTGYNGPPSGMPHCEAAGCDLQLPCTRSSHAEANAIAWAAREGIKLWNSELYMTHSPCPTCARMVINAGIHRVLYRNEYRDPAGVVLLRVANIDCEQYRGALDELVY